jgi:glutaredoxin
VPAGADRVIAITVYSKPGCHLCEEMKLVVARVVGDSSAAVEEIDISTDPDLEARYGLEIPVLMVNGRKVAKYRIGEAELRRVLSRVET